MALTKVTGQVIKNTTDVTVGVLTVTNTLAVGGTVSIGGTLTYEDVTNVDAVGLITARNGIVVGSGITLSKDGDIFATGVTTATTFSGAFSGSGANITAINASNIGSGTVPTARLGSGTASSSTFLRGDSTFAAVTSTTINSNTNNYLITGTGTADTLQGESGLTYDGDTLTNDAALRNIQAGSNYVLIGSSNAGGVTLGLDGDSNGDGAGTDYAFIEHDTSGDLNIVGDNPANASNIIFKTNSATERARIDSSGRLLIGTTTAGNGDGDDLTIATSGRTGMTIRSANDDYGNIFFSDSTSGASEYIGKIQYYHADNSMRFATSSTDRLRIHSDGALSTALGSQLSHKSGGDKLVYADMQQYTVNDSTNSYHTMKTWKADKSGSFTLEVSMHNSPGTYYWSYIVYNVTQSIRVNQAGSGGDSNNLKFNEGLASGESANVHDYRRFSITCGATEGSIKVGDQLELRMASSDINGNLVTGNGQTQYANGLKLFSTTGNPGTGAIDGHGYNAAMNTRNCCYWWLDRNGNYNGFNSQSESTAIPFNRLIESANFGSAEHYNGVVTIKQDGVYALNASAYSGTGGVAFTQGWWIVSGTRHTGCDIVLGDPASIMSMSGFMYLTAGQTVGFHPHYSGSNSIQITDSSYHTYFRGCLINATNATRNSYV